MKSLVLVYLLVVILGCVGYVYNICRFCFLDFKPSYKAEVIRGVGIFIPPVGAITGFIPIYDGVSE